MKIIDKRVYKVDEEGPLWEATVDTQPRDAYSSEEEISKSQEALKAELTGLSN